MQHFVARLFLFTSLLCFVLFCMLLYQRYRPNPLGFQGAVFTRELSETYTAKPVRLAIPRLGIDLPVFGSEVNGTTWQTHENGVSYLKSTPLPGTVGNSVLYGHNWPNLLGPIRYSKVSDKIIVSYADGQTVSFVVAYIATVSPEQVKILENSKDSRLTIYTCTGFLDSKRFVVTALKE